MNGNDSRALKRHALARLWWVARPTVSTVGMGGWSSKYSGKRRIFSFTKFVLANKFVYTEVFERTFGNNRVIRMAIIWTLRERPEHMGRKSLRPIMKELVLLSGVKRLAIMPSARSATQSAKSLQDVVAGRVDSQS